MSREFLNRKNGFTLTELLISLSLMVFVIVSVMLMMTMLINRNAYANDVSRALQLAEEGMEILRRVSYTPLPGNNNDLLDYVNRDEVFTPNNRPLYAGFRREFRVQYDNAISTLTVTVYWRRQGSDSAPIVLASRRVLQ